MNDRRPFKSIFSVRQRVLEVPSESTEETTSMSFITKIVKNDAIKTDPPQIYNWRVYVLSCSACFAGMLFGMDIGIIGGVLKLDTFRK